MNKVLPILALSDNYIWAIPLAIDPADANAKQKVIIVDPGDHRPVVDCLRANNLQLAAILITHHCFDHVGGLKDLLAYQSVPVYGPSISPHPLVDHPVNAGDEIHFDDQLKLSAMALPGHTLNHIGFYTKGMAFVGDTLFAGGCGRLHEGSTAQMHASLNQLAALPEDTLIYGAHEYTTANLRFAQAVEPDNQALKQRMLDTHALRAQNQPTVPSTLALELATNPFMRCHLDSVKAAAEQHAGRPLSDAATVFAIVRFWKDTY